MPRQDRPTALYAAALSILASIIMPVADQHRRGQAHGIAHNSARAVAGLDPEPKFADLVVIHLELGRHVGLTRLSGGRRLEVVAAATDSASRCTHDRQHHTDEEHDDSDGPEDRNLEQESGDEQDDSKDDHGSEPFCPPDCPLGNRTGRAAARR
jgi:hypothetical protein